MDAPHPPSLTDQQHAAIHTRHVSIALSAGAGCGKTFVLTQRFLSHLAPGPGAAKLSSLVAITFTDRAAREMRDRIRSACRERLQNCPPEHVAHWLEILYGLDAARITTIHSFCTSLLRSHAAEAGLDPRFAVADAAQTDALVRQSARDTLHGLLEKQNEDAIALVLQFGLERARDTLASLITQRFRTTRERLASITAEESQAAWLKVWQEECVPQAVQALIDQPIIKETRDWLEEHAPKPNAVIFARCQAVRALLAEPSAAKTSPAAWLTELREQAKVMGGGGKSAWNDPNELAELTELWKDLREDVDTCLKRIDYAPNDLPLAAEMTERASRLALAAWDHYESQKRTTSHLDFDDLLLRTRDLLRDRPEVAKRLADRVQLLMVDEFQDTDQVQADMIRSLVGPALATGKLFLVGDEKQSIYRFRRADPRVFRQVQAEIPPAGNLPLSINFRSQPEILNFVNILFKRTWGEEAYQSLIPHAAQQSASPTIEFLWATSDVPGSGPPASHADKQNAEALRRREAAWIARRIAQLLADPTLSVRGEKVNGETPLRCVKAGDIVILFRTLSDAPVYEAALAELGLDYYLVGGKTFFAQQEVFDLLNLCRWLADPAEEIALVGCLRSPFFNLSDDAIFALQLAGPTISEAVMRTPPEWLEPEDRARIGYAGRVLSELRQLKDQLTPSELLRAAIERTGYDAALLHEYLGARKVANLEKLIRRAVEFDDAELFTLHDYVRDLEQSVDEQTDEALAATLPEAGNVVRLMTIHQSKGLEFPVVIVADLNRHGHGRGGSVLMHEDWGVLLQPPPEFGVKHEHLGLEIHKFQEQTAEAEEIQRLLYVAVTRAADRLILSAGMTLDLKAVSPWMRLLDQHFQLGTGLLKGDPYLGSLSGAGAGRECIPGILVHREPPPEPATSQSHDRLVPLRLLPELVLSAEAEAFPESLRVYPTANDWHDLISVSQLDADAAHSQERRPFEDEDFEVIDVPRAPADVVGTLFHHVLQRLDVRHPAEWPEVLAACACQLGDDPQKIAAATSHVEPMLTRLIGSELMRDFAAADVLEREVDFILGWPLDAKSQRVLLSGQIDVLMRNSDGWHLIDYKTGRFPPSVADAELIAPYAVQLGVYALAAEKQLGWPLQSISLVVMNPQVRRIVFAWDQSVRQKLVERIETLIRAGGVSPLNVP